MSSEILICSSNVSRFASWKYTFSVFPVKKMAELGVRFSEVLMFVPSCWESFLSSGSKLFHENKIDASIYYFSVTFALFLKSIS